jgi:hypothetical protein
MEPRSKVPATADQSSLNMLHKLPIGCFLLLKVVANTLQVNSVTVNGRMHTVDCHHDITVSTVSVAFLVKERSQYYFLLCYEIKCALPVRDSDVAGSTPRCVRTAGCLLGGPSGNSLWFWWNSVRISGKIGHNSKFKFSKCESYVKI